MSKLTFFADQQDLNNIIDFILNEDVGKIYEYYSALNEPVRKVEGLEDVRATGIGEPKNKDDLFLLQVIPSGIDNGFRFRENEVRTNGASGIRTSVEGYSLVQFYLGGLISDSNSILGSVLSSGNAATLKRRAVNESEKDLIENVDWNSVKKCYSSIAKFIKTKGKRIGGADDYILPSAEKRNNEGCLLATTL
jgi:hypothetical protein